MSLAIAGLLGWSVLRAAPVDTNANSKYKVESVEIVPARHPKISRGLREELTKLVGRNLNQAAVDRVRERLQTETEAQMVAQRLVKGTAPGTVKIVLEVQRKQRRLDIEVPRLIYYARQGWSGGADGVAQVSGHTGSFGFRNDGDALVERFAGIRGGYEYKDIAGRFGFGVEFEDYRAQWSDSTLAALGPEGVEGTEKMPGLYRLRRVVQPSITIRLLDSLVYQAGVSVQNLEMQFPAARTEAANAVRQTLRFQRRWRNSNVRHSFDAGYNLHAATRILSSDFAYTRHSWDARYRGRRDDHQLTVALQAGVLGGRAPLFERFVAGSATVLRGWNKFDITPAGADRLVAGSVEYGYKGLRMFWDVGSAWNRTEVSHVRQSLGVGVRAGKHGPLVAVAFPLRDGRVSATFMTSLDF